MKERQLLDTAIENFIHGAYKKAQEDKIIFIKNIGHIIRGYSAPFGAYKEHYETAAEQLTQNPNQDLVFQSPLAAIVEKRRETNRFVRDFKIARTTPGTFEVMGQMGQGFNWFSFRKCGDLETAYRIMLLAHLTALAPEKMPKVGIRYPQIHLNRNGTLEIKTETFVAFNTYCCGLRESLDDYQKSPGKDILDLDSAERVVNDFIETTYRQQLKTFKKFQQK